MSVTGDLRTMELSDVLQWIAARARTGTLQLQRRSTIKRLRTALAATARESVYESFLWTDGRFSFTPEEAGPANVDLDTVALLAEGARRAKLWRRLRERFPSADVAFRALQPEPELAHPLDRKAYRLAAEGGSLAEISLHMRQSEFAAAERLFRLCEEGLLEVEAKAEAPAATDVVGAIQGLMAEARARAQEGRFSAARDAYEGVLVLDSLNAEALAGLREVGEQVERTRVARQVPLTGVPAVRLGTFALTQQSFDPEEAFVLSRINGQWDVRSILKLCPMNEEEALLIFLRLLERQAIEMQ
jgi:hypothetical protein